MCVLLIFSRALFITPSLTVDTSRQIWIVRDVAVRSNKVTKDLCSYIKLTKSHSTRMKMFTGCGERAHYYLLQRLFSLSLIGMRSKIIDISSLLYIRCHLRYRLHCAFHKNHVLRAEHARLHDLELGNLELSERSAFESFRAAPSRTQISQIAQFCAPRP